MSGRVTGSGSILSALAVLIAQKPRFLQSHWTLVNKSLETLVLLSIKESEAAATGQINVLAMEKSKQTIGRNDQPSV